MQRADNIDISNHALHIFMGFRGCFPDIFLVIFSWLETKRTTFHESVVSAPFSALLRDRNLVCQIDRESVHLDQENMRKIWPRLPLDYPVLHPFVDEDESKKFRSSGNCRKPALAVGSLAGRLECVASPESKHTKNLPQTDEKRGITIIARVKT